MKNKDYTGEELELWSASLGDYKILKFEQSNMDKDGKVNVKITIQNPNYFEKKPEKVKREVLNFDDFIDDYVEKNGYPDELMSTNDWSEKYEDYLSDTIGDMYEPKTWLWNEFFDSSLNGNPDMVSIKDYFGKEWYDYINDMFFDNKIDDIFNQFESDLMDMEN